MADSYTVKKLNKSNNWEINKFTDNSFTPVETYTVSKTKDFYWCNCMGFRRQKNKDEHKHIKLVKFWESSLEGQPGFVFWFDGQDIEYNNMFFAE
jgi:hypothetical protein